MTDKFEFLVQGLLKDEYGIVEDFVSPPLVARLRSNLLARLAIGKMSKAGVGQHASFHENHEVRRDQISWIDDDQSDSGEEEYFRLLWDFLGYLNDTCYTGLNAFESHYAHYGQGSFYRRHLDQFKTDSGRKYSLVLYLNDLWLEGDGGQLVIYRKDDQVSISPQGGTIVFFQSDHNEHEVLPAARERMSIAGWMKRLC
ncbi:MAG: 2OG-Fe(II) oxygenase [Saprospiraceae bacterium]|nr:2OG-Fe(II) oxygenase [Candidatus Opimibacter iunctus]